MRKKVLITLLFLAGLLPVNGQGYNHNFLIGYTTAMPPWTFHDKGIIKVDSLGFGIFGLSRKMKIQAAQANIANDTGAILFYTNGCWIANALEDTMLNGNNLSPDPLTTQWCNSFGIVYNGSSLIIPFPADSSKYILFHHSGNQSDPNSYPLISYYSVIDMNLDAGLGGVVAGTKNTALIQDTLNPGFAACKHANGRDWWVTILKGNSNKIYVTLVTPQGVQSPIQLSLGTNNHSRETVQSTFSQDGKKFAYRYYSGSFGNATNEVRIFDFDRCSGTFSNPQIISWPSQIGSLGLAFSSNSKYIYTVSDFDTIYQINTDTTNMQASMTVVAINDGYFSPFPPQQSDFWTMYLAANGKIIISSGGGTVDLHYINYPDSAGLACDVQQHALHLPCWTLRSHVNHPNYYLGCDTTQTTCPCLTGISEPGKHDFKFSLSPNPSSGFIKILYLLPQNRSGVFEVYDITGKKVFTYPLPPWSTLQHFDLGFLEGGVYQCVITSDGSRVSKKFAVIK